MKAVSKINLEILLNLPLRFQKLAFPFLKSPMQFGRIELRSASRTRIIAALEPANALSDLAFAIRTVKVREPVVIEHIAHKLFSRVPNESAQAQPPDRGVER